MNDIKNKIWKKRRHAGSVSIACILAAAILLVGTFAWNSISQKAVNEMDRSVTVGGRLHDDFDGTYKAVYAENYMTKNDGGRPIYVRIRLDEYMEFGEEAGENRKSSNRLATPAVEGTDINDVTTWITHIPETSDPTLCEGESASFHDYYTLTMGGSAFYMPTFNKDNESLEADINGTYANDYQDFIGYNSDRTKKTDTASYAGGESRVESHYSTSTRSATVITMEQWKKKYNCEQGDYWVYDTDGWAYWAKAIKPGDTTGCLLKRVELTGDLIENVYYAINVEAQFATPDDWGSADNPVGFYEGYDPENGVLGPTEDALFLLYQAAGLEYDVTAQTLSRSAQVQTGESLVFASEVTCMGRVTDDQAVTWKVKGAMSDDTVISEEGVLTVGSDETAEELKVTAKYLNKSSETLTVKVVQ